MYTSIPVFKSSVKQVIDLRTNDVVHQSNVNRNIFRQFDRKFH